MDGDNYCNTENDADLAITSSSDDYTPRFEMLTSQYARHGGVWFGNGGGGETQASSGAV